MFEWLKDKAKWAYYGLAEKASGIVGKGAGEAAKLKFFKTVLTNMASKIIGMLHDSLNAETSKNGKQATKNAKKIAHKAEKGAVSKNMAKAPSRQASMGAKAPAMAAAKPILSTDINATIAKATLAAGKGSQALISGKGLDTKALDIGR